MGTERVILVPKVSSAAVERLAAPLVHVSVVTAMRRRSGPARSTEATAAAIDSPRVRCSVPSRSLPMPTTTTRYTDKIIPAMADTTNVNCVTAAP